MQVQTTTWAEIERLDEAAMMTRPPTAAERAAMALGCAEHGNGYMNWTEERVYCMACTVAVLAQYELPVVRPVLAGVR